MEQEANKLPFTVGEKVFLQTVTYHFTGKIKAIGGGFITLSEAAWVADSGRFMQALEKGKLGEVEPVVLGDVRIAVGSVVGVFEWHHELPREQKPR